MLGRKSNERPPRIPLLQEQQEKDKQLREQQAQQREDARLQEQHTYIDGLIEEQQDLPQVLICFNQKFDSDISYAMRTMIDRGYRAVTADISQAEMRSTYVIILFEKTDESLLKRMLER